MSDDGLVCEVLTEPRAFAALAPEWERLYAASPRATPFQTHGWLNAWLNAYGPSQGLRTAVVYDARGTLVAAAPLYLRRRGGVRVLSPLGGTITDYTDILVAEEGDARCRAGAAVDRLARTLRDLPGWDVVDLPEVRPGAAAELLAHRWSAPQWTFGASMCMELHVSCFEELLGRLSGKRAGEVRRRVRRADALGLEATELSSAELEDGVRDLIRLHLRQWRGRGGNQEHLTARFSTHLCAAVGAMVRDGSAVLTRFRLQGEVVAVTLRLEGHDMACGYLMGVAPELFSKIDVTAVVLRQELRHMASRGLSTFSMLRGAEQYKERWRPDMFPNRRVLLGRLGDGPAHFYAAAVLVRGWAAEAARERAPWLRQVRGQVAMLRGLRTRQRVIPPVPGAAAGSGSGRWPG